MSPLSWTRRLIYFPESVVPPPEVMLPGAEEVSFRTEDGLDLQAWWLPGGEGPIATVAVFHGNAGTRADRSDLAAALFARGMSVLLTDYRGYGGNPGSPSEEGLIADGRAAVAYLRSRPDVDADRLALFGESLGSGVAVAVAAEDRPAVVVLRSPFTSFADVAKVHYPFIPAEALLADRFDSLARIGRVAAPILVIAGTSDEIVPAGQSRELYEAANEPKRLLIVEGAGHNDWVMLAGNQVMDAVAGFAAEHAGAA
jgi:fermentation-respiration switch protein FrsA (DUF1100 family)